MEALLRTSRSPSATVWLACFRSRIGAPKHIDSMRIRATRAIGVQRLSYEPPSDQEAFCGERKASRCSRKPPHARNWSTAAKCRAWRSKVGAHERHGASPKPSKAAGGEHRRPMSAQLQPRSSSQPSLAARARLYPRKGSTGGRSNPPVERYICL